MAAVAAWSAGELELTLRVALVPVAQIRAQGVDVRVARYGPSESVSYAMFSGGGLAFADGSSADASPNAKTAARPKVIPMHFANSEVFMMSS